jgi:hypothetical protein
LVPVLVLGGVLAANYRAEARRRGIDEGRAQAVLVARTGVEPLLSGHPLSDGVTSAEEAGMARLVARTVRARDVLRLRVRDLAGRVVFADDGKLSTSGFEDEAVGAARGEVVARLIRLNSDPNDVGAAGAESVEVYTPLRAGAPLRQIGVLEVYLPYAPIKTDISAGLHTLYRDLAFGLAALYLVLFAISASVGRGLRRQVKLNAFLARHDGLTDLPNRTLFRSRATDALRAASRSRWPSRRGFEAFACPAVWTAQTVAHA